jgi:hypothetical protein
LHRRFNDSECDEGATTWNVSKGAKRRDDNDDDVDKSTKGAPRKQRMLREHAYKGRDWDTTVATRVTSPLTRRRQYDDDCDDRNLGHRGRQGVRVERDNQQKATAWRQTSARSAARATIAKQLR